MAKIPATPVQRWRRNDDGSIYKSDGNVSIGTDTSNELLTVEGVVSLKESNAPTATSGYTKLYVDSGGNLHIVDGAGTDTTISAASDSAALANAIQTIRKDLDGYQTQITGLGGTELEHYVQHSAAIQTILKDLDGYSATDQEHYVQHSAAIQIIRKDLDGYQDQITSNKNYITAHGNAIQTIRKDLDGYNTTITEHYDQHSAAINSITKDLDGYATTPATGSDGYVAFYTGSSGIAGDNDLYWDRENNRLRLSGLLQFSGSTNEYPAMGRVGRDIWFRTGDDGYYTSIAAMTVDAYGPVNMWQGATVPDDTTISFGTGSDATIQYTPGRLVVTSPNDSIWLDGKTGVNLLYDGASKWFVDAAGDFTSALAAGPGLQDENATVTNPTVVPNRLDVDTGLGQTTDVLTLVAGGVEGLRVTETGGSTIIGLEGAEATNPAIKRVGRDIWFRTGDDGDFTSIAADSIDAYGTIILQNTGEQIIVPQENAAATPSIAFGDGDTGFYESAADTLGISTGGARRVGVNSTGMFSTNANGPLFSAAAASGTTPSLVPDRSDTDTGIGQGAADALSLISGGVEAVRITESGGSTILNFEGVTDEFPAMKRVGRDVWFRKGDDTGYTSIAIANLDAYGTDIKFGVDDTSNVNINTGGGDIVMNKSLVVGQTQAPADAGAIIVMDMPVSATPAAATEMSTGFAIDANTIFTAYAEADGSGGVQNTKLKVDSGQINFTGIAADNPAITGVGRDVWFRSGDDGDFTSVALDHLDAYGGINLFSPTPATRGIIFDADDDGDTYIRAGAADNDIIVLSSGGSEVWYSDGVMEYPSTGLPRINWRETGSATNPVFIPRRELQTSMGIGGRSTGELSLISGATEAIKVGTANSASTAVVNGDLAATNVIASTSVLGNDVLADPDGYLGFENRSHIKSAVSGDITLYDDGETTFNMLQFGGTSAILPAIQRVGEDIWFRKADDSAYTSIACANLDAYGTEIGFGIDDTSDVTIRTGGGDIVFNNSPVIGTIQAPEDAGAVIIMDMPVSATPAAATEMSFGFAIDSNTIFTAYAEADSSGGIQAPSLIMGSARIQGTKGSDVASADEITLGSGNYFDITGTTTINHITKTNWQAGSVVTLQFDGSVTVTHNSGSPTGSEASILLSGAGNFSATANDTLTLVYDGTTWREVARTVI